MYYIPITCKSTIMKYLWKNMEYDILPISDLYLLSNAYLY